MTAGDAELPEFSDQLLAWWDASGRKDLPWQDNPTPYRVWISEVMLQQTQVATVENYFPRFMKAFPDVRALASAEQDAVLHLWSGLGYYARARNMHRAARSIVDLYGGELPRDLEALMTLPGIGRSTAGAILALSAGQRHPILDGNVKRVLARVYAVSEWTGSARVQKNLWSVAESLTPARRVSNYTQAIMDLGATVCRRSRPVCDVCPLAGNCRALELGATGRIPAPRPKKARPCRSTTMVLAVDGKRVLLEKRPQSGIWGGLWSLPEIADTDPAEWCASTLGITPERVLERPGLRHGFTHFELEITPVEVRLTRPPDFAMDGDRWLWYNTARPARIGLAAPVTKLIAGAGDNS
jgi:A/G-specific adenine glycosylase